MHVECGKANEAQMSQSEETDYRQDFCGMMTMMAQDMSHAVLQLPVK